MLAVTTHTGPSKTGLSPSCHEAVGWLRAVALDRDRRAFECLYGYFAPRVKSYMIRQGADPASAEDLTQDAMVQIWRKAHQYDPVKAAPSSWVFRIARNLQIDRLRRQRLHEVELTAEVDGADDLDDSHRRSLLQPDTDRLLRLVGELPADQLDVVKLAFFEGLSHSEIGQRLSLPLGTVKSRMRLAFGKLRAAMGGETC
jgi:RNA polymerase sigma-70 factor (ECF subfamily)